MKLAIYDQEFQGFCVLFALMISSGTIFYHLVEKWSLLDSLYFSIVALATVGFGDFTPQTAAGKIFTIFYILIGVGIIFGFINIMAHHALKDIERQRTKRKEKIGE